LQRIKQKNRARIEAAGKTFDGGEPIHGTDRSIYWIQYVYVRC
jgi:hypothetical protein